MKYLAGMFLAAPALVMPAKHFSLELWSIKKTGI